ncbi:MAG: hypothetical protein ACUVWJ_04160 [Spirochaetota bacterium]
MQDRELGKTFVPLAKELEMTPHKHYQAKAMEVSTGLGEPSILHYGKQ